MPRGPDVGEPGGHGLGARACCSCGSVASSACMPGHHLLPHARDAEEQHRLDLAEGGAELGEVGAEVASRENSKSGR